jgi:hypothetical protein
MKTLTWAFLACLALGSLAAGSARATSTIPCAVGTIATVMAEGPCTIGDKTFVFTSLDLLNSGTASNPNAAADVTFTPLTANPLNPGFELATFNSTDLSGLTQELGALYYTVSVTDGSANLIGINAIANNPTVATAPAPANAKTGASLEAANNLFSVGASAYQSVDQFQFSGSSPSNSPFSTGTITFAPVSSGSGNAFFGTTAYDQNTITGTYGGSGTAEAAMSSADYTFLEAAPSTVPEPGTLVLFGSGLVSLAGLARRKIFRA